ncbi:sensor domain-containing protein [Actinoallomurus spadix]|uniref:histidine kinase n=1 Tax=Actinoallomurus spadix TaxID=79912 RepID=A0ABN0WIV9_9ACTN|nr:sensor domain-containing protein [Actinoallomurus spadix]MCO5990603.1 sensor domain-containing protein [Actinoallomurus spadix]
MRPTRSSTAWQALTRRGFLLSAWPWRSIAYLVTGVPIGAGVFVLGTGLFVIGSATAVVLVGIPLLALLGLSGIPLAAVERRRLRLVDPETPVRGVHRERVNLFARYGEQATWRELSYAVVFGLLLWPLDLAAVVLGLSVPLGVLGAPLLLALIGRHGQVKILKSWTVSTSTDAWALVPIGALMLVVALYGLTVVAGARAAIARVLLVPREDELTARLVDVSRSRARLVDAFDVERRRIERDLHDGAQQRLVALTLTLGLARMAEGEEAAALLAQAHDESKRALDELRALVRGVHPQILTDRGLPAAVTELAGRSPLPVDLDFDLPGRLPGQIETAAYFVVSEALSNVAKHSGAGRAAVTGRVDAGRLVLEIWDDGVGGADSGGGTGLTGLADRISVVDGRLALSSPPGGPTVIHVEIPCTRLDRSG